MAKKDERGAVERLKNRLYARKNDIPAEQKRAPLPPSGAHAPTSWDDDIHPPEPPAPQPAVPDHPLKIPVGFENAGAPAVEVPAPAPTPSEDIAMKKRHLSFATKFFLGSIAFFVIALGIASALFFGGINTTSPNNIDVQVIVPSVVDGGKVAQLEFIVTNRNTTALEGADLVVEYPDGARSAADPTQNLTQERISIGTIQSGQQIKKTTSAIFYGQEGQATKLTARLEYNVAGSNAVFEKAGEASFTVGSAPVSITVGSPDSVVAGQEFTEVLTVRSNATAPVNNVTIEAQYPFGFSVSAAQPSADVAGKLWHLGTMQPGSSKVIQITGSLQASDGDERVFKFVAGSNADQTDTTVKVPFLVIPQTVTVEQPFITGSISVGGQSGSSVSAAAGSKISGVVNWKNNLSDALSDVELVLYFDGPALDRNSIEAQNGFFQSKDTSLVWTKSQDPALASVAPGGTGSYQFSFSTLPPGAQNVLITNPTITLNLSVRATRSGSTGSSNAVTTAASTKVLLASQLALTAVSTQGGSGPVPPRAEQTTAYTITWTVQNSANSVANAYAEATLPPYMEFGASKSGSAVTYNASSRTVHWALGDVKAGVGYTSAAKQASFTVLITPSASQIGSAPALTGQTTVSGQDRFTQEQVSAAAPGPTTNTDDGANGVVQ